MINLYDLGQVYIVCGKTDMRKGIDTLAYLVKEKFELDPFSGRVFLFCGGKHGKMNWPKNQDEVKALTSEQVDWLMQGFSITPKINDAKARNFY